MNTKRPENMSRPERLNFIVNRMRVQQDITPTILSDELQVSVRTIYRDLRYLQRGKSLHKRYSRKEGRYVFEQEMDIPPLSLTPSEALSLFYSACNPALSSDNFASRDLRGALTKIRTSLTPKPSGENTEQVAIPVTEVGYSAESVQRPTIEMIRRAMRTNRKIGIKYWSSATDTERHIIVSPFVLEEMNGHLYLAGKSEEEGEIRAFKTVRIRAVELLSESFRFPRHFVANNVFEKAWEAYDNQDEEVEVKVRFAASVSSLITDTPCRQFTSIQREPDGHLVYTTTVNSLKEIAWWIFSFGANAEVISPPVLREQFAKQISTLNNRYTKA